MLRGLGKWWCAASAWERIAGISQTLLHALRCRVNVASAIPDDAWLRLRQAGPVDLVVGIPSFNNETTIRHVIRTAAEGMITYFPKSNPLILHSDGGSTDETRKVVAETDVPAPVQVVSFVYQGLPGKGTALEAVLEATEHLGAQGCVVLDSDLRSVSPDWIELLAGPIINEDYDYVAPRYVRHKYDGTITNNLAYPLTRALYGLDVRQPIGGDFGISGDLASHYLGKDVWRTDVARFGIDIFMTTVAINDGFAVCQSELGAKIHDVKDPAASLGPMFVQVLGTLFALMETYEARWQSVVGSKPTAIYGTKKAVEPEPVAVTLAAMIERFRNGAQAFESLWVLALDADSLKRTLDLTSLGIDRFKFPADLWAHVVYDFVSSYHHAQRLGLNRDDVVTALTPLYYGRTASVVIEAAEMDVVQFEQLVDAQARVFEGEKPYLIRRWQSLGAT